MSDEHIIIEYSLDGGRIWHHGRTLPAWVTEPAHKAALRAQKTIVRETARLGHEGDVDRVITRVLSEEDPRAEVNRVGERPAEVTVTLRRWVSYAGRPLQRRRHWEYGCTGPDGREFQDRHCGELLMAVRRAYPGVAIYAIELWK